MIAAYAIMACFFVLLAVFGYLMAVHVLRIRNALAIAGMVFVCGPAMYLVFANGLAHLMPVRWAFWLALWVCTGASVVLALHRRAVQGVGWLPPSTVLPPRYVLWTFGVMILLTGIIGVRNLGSDPWSWTHFPLAATIAEGNFPVVGPTNPWHRVSYHYGPALLAAALHVISGVSFPVAYAPQPLLGGAGILLFVGALLFEIMRSWRCVFWGSLLALAGGGLAWLHVFPLFRDLYTHFALGQVLDGPFRALVPMFHSPITNSLFVVLSHRSFAVGYPLLFASVYCLHGALRETDSRGWCRWVAVSIMFASALALVMETGLVILAGAAAIYVLLRRIIKKANDDAAVEACRTAWTWCAIFIPSAIIALLQGGVLSTHAGYAGPASFSWALDGRIYLTAQHLIGVWEWQFWRDFGVPLLLFPLVVISCWRRRKLSTFPLFLCLLMFLHFLIPLTVRFVPHPFNMNRLFYGATSLLSLLAGVFLVQTCLGSRKQFRRIIGYSAISAMLVSSVVFALVALLFPTLHLERAPLFATLPPLSTEEQALYQWVRASTSIRDYFYVPVHEDDNDFQSSQILFMTHAGRFAIGPRLADSFAKERMQQVEKIRRCDSAAFRALTIRYVVSLSPEHEAWFRLHCDPQDWVIRYKGSPGAPSPRVYRLS